MSRLRNSESICNLCSLHESRSGKAVHPQTFTVCVERTLCEMNASKSIIAASRSFPLCQSAPVAETAREPKFDSREPSTTTFSKPGGQRLSGDWAFAGFQRQRTQKKDKKGNGQKSASRLGREVSGCNHSAQRPGTREGVRQRKKKKGTRTEEAGQTMRTKPTDRGGCHAL